MISKILGYTIGSLFVIGLLFGPGLGLYLGSKDTLKAINYDGKTQGKVIKCQSIRISNSNKARYNRVPIVKTQSGSIVKGTIDEIKYIWPCDKQIGKIVEVLYNKEEPSQAKINTFLEMWFLPLLLFLICCIWYSALIIGYIKKYNKSAR
jgi:hypothetical protein